MAVPAKRLAVKLPARRTRGALEVSVATNASATTPTLVEVLWNHSKLVTACIAVSILIAVLYLALATRVYRAGASVVLDASTPSILGGHAGGPISENFNQTRADEIQSAPVLRRAADDGRFAELKTFAGIDEDIVLWLKEEKVLQVQPARRSDIVTVTMESAYPEEAVAVVNAIIQAYIREKSQFHVSTGTEAGTLLDQERAALTERRKNCRQELAELSRDAGIPILGDNTGNTTAQRAATLSASVTQAETRLIDLRAQYDSLTAALKTPEALPAFVESMQFRGRDFGDAEYDELRQQLSTLELNLTSIASVQGPQHTRVVLLQKSIAQLKERIAKKEELIARAHLQSLETEIASAESSRAALRVLMGRELEETDKRNPSAMRFAQVYAELQRIDRQLETLEQRSTEIRVDSAMAGPMGARILEPASVSTRPVRPQSALTLAIAALTGALVGTGLAMARELHDARLHAVEEIPRLLGVSVIALVPRVTQTASPLARGVIVSLDPRSAAAEAYRSLRTIIHLGLPDRPRSIVVTSATAGDGKSTTASNLAIAFAQAGERTLLIDGDLRGPVQHMIFELNPDVGLTSVLSARTKLREAIVPTRVACLHALPCGPVPTHPSELLDSTRFARLLRAMSARFDRIIIDSPPLGSTPDAAILASLADATLLVTRMNHSPRRLVVQASAVLRRVGANLIGAVANDVSARHVSISSDGSWQYSAHARRFVTQRLEAVGAATNGGNGKQLAQNAALARRRSMTST